MQSKRHTNNLWEDKMDENNNPFVALSQIFIDTQRVFNQKCKDLSQRTHNLSSKLSTVREQLEADPFSTNLNMYLNIEEESKLILVVAKEVEHQREKILKTVDLLKNSNKIQLNK